jgi:hypothetical protein
MPGASRIWRVVGCLLLAASGLLMIAASRERWWPACRLGDFESSRCLKMQDHRYDFLPPMDPWSPIGEAATLAGVSLVLLGVVAGGLPLLLPVARHRRLVAALQVVVAVGLATVGLAAVASAAAGRPSWESLAAPAGLVWVLVWPVTVILTTAWSSRVAVRPRLGLLGAGLLVGSSPLPQLFFAPLFVSYLSHDTSPWGEAVGGAFLVCAAVVLWLATAPVETKDGPPLSTVGVAP